MWRSVFSSWLHGGVTDLSPWAHAFEWARIEEAWEKDPRRPTAVDLITILDEADRLIAHAVARTFGWASDARQCNQSMTVEATSAGG